MSWFTITSTQYFGIIASAIILYIILLLIIKLNGLRSFSKMSAHDFAVTVSIGSIFATTIVSKEPTVLQGGLAISVLFVVQSLFSKWRLNRNTTILENEPILLMDGPNILYKNLKKAKITKNDLIAKLREANVLQFQNIKAVVLEATGDISVLHGDIEEKLCDKLITNIRR